MLKGRIIEFSEWPTITEFKSDIPYPLFKEGVRLRKLLSNEVIYQDPSFKMFYYGGGGVWLSCVVKRKKKHVFLDVYNRGIKFKEAKGGFLSRHFVEDKEVFVTEVSLEKSNVNIYNYSTGKEVSNDFGECFKCDVDAEYIVATSVFSDIRCANMQAEILWEKKNMCMKLGRGMIYPKIFNELVIVNLGVDRESQVDCKIAAFCKENGKVKWEKNFKEFSPSKVIGDKVYIAHQGRGIVLDASSGVTLMEVETNIDKPNFDDTFWPYEQYLCYTSYVEATFFVFDQVSGKLVQTLKAPPPFYLSPSEYPVYWQDKAYLTVGLEDWGLKGAVYGLLTLEKASTEDEAVITIEPRLEHLVLTVPEDNGEGYHLIINDTNLEKVVRYGELILQSYAKLRGSHDFSDERQNKNFNGHLYFSAPIDKLGTEAKNELNAMANRVGDWCKDMVLASRGDDPITVKIVPMPDMTNDLLKHEAPPIEYK